ncbi:MAG TPA: hypothetical protein VJK54_01550, partial [Chthoniobacterales bacterium]|nr:hypothetical protein [Chthoniobacterales bacterium]
PTTIRTAATTVAFRESQDVRLNPSAECAPTNHQNVSNGAYSSSSQLSSSVSYLPSQGTQVEEKGDGAASFSKEIFIAADQAWWQHGKVWRHYKEAPGAAKARAHIMQKAAVDEAEAAEALARTMCPPVVMMEAAEQMITKRSSVQVIWSSRIAQAEQALAQAQAEVRETEWSQTKRAQRTLERAEVIVTAERAALDAIMVQIKGERAFSSAQIAKTESAWTDAMNNAQAAKAMWNHMIATIKWLDHLPHPIVSGKERAWLLEEYKHAEVQETRWTQKIALANFKMAFLKRDKALIAAENASITALADARRVEAVRTEVAWMKARDTAQAAASAWEGAIYASKQFFSMVSREGKMRLAAEIAQAKVQKDKWSKQYASIDLMVLVAQAENSVKKANDCQVVAENYRTEEAW